MVARPVPVGKLLSTLDPRNLSGKPPKLLMLSVLLPPLAGNCVRLVHIVVISDRWCRRASVAQTHG